MQLKGDFVAVNKSNAIVPRHCLNGHEDNQAGRLRIVSQNK